MPPGESPDSTARGTRAATLSDGAAGGGAIAGGVLAIRFGPGAVAMAFFEMAINADVAGGGDFLFEGAKIRAKGIVGNNADLSVFECSAQGEGDLLFEGTSRFEALGFPAEALSGALVKVVPDALSVKAAALEL